MIQARHTAPLSEDIVTIYSNVLNSAKGALSTRDAPVVYSLRLRTIPAEHVGWRDGNLWPANKPTAVLVVSLEICLAST